MTTTTEAPSWKRALEELITTTETEEQPPRKRQRPFEPDQFQPAGLPSGRSEVALRLLGQLENGLNFIQSMDFSPEAKKHALELRKLLLKEATNSLTSFHNGDHQHANGSSNGLTNGSTNGDGSNNDHTSVPPPLSTVKVPAYNNISNHTSTQEWGLPPLPPITELTLLSAPFTHTSALPHYMPATSTNTYEPLEFLGDAYLELISTRLIHNIYPMHTVGQKANLREILIKNETLAGYAKDYGLDKRIKYGGGQGEAMVGAKWQKIMADVFEAYVACIILSDEENGFRIAEEWLQELWQPKMLEWREKGEGKSTGLHEFLSMDVKSELQRLLVSKGVKLEYLEEKAMELDRVHNRTTFYMAVYLTGWGHNKLKLGSGTGRSKQLAGAEAAKDAFMRNRALLQDAHQKKLEFDKAHRKRAQHEHRLTA